MWAMPCPRMPVSGTATSKIVLPCPNRLILGTDGVAREQDWWRDWWRRGAAQFLPHPAAGGFHTWPGIGGDIPEISYICT